MSNEKSQANASHHYIQQAYLDKFADNGRIDVIDRQTGKVRPRQHVKEIAKIRGLYSVELENGKKDGGLEGAFEKEVERPGMKVINKMTSVLPYVPQGEERTILSYYIAFQYLRTLEAKKRFQNDGGLYASIELFNSANDPDKLGRYLKSKGKDDSQEAVSKLSKSVLDYLNDDNFRLVPHSNLWLSMINEGMKTIAPILYERYHWHLFYYDQPSLVTSDHPVVLRRIYSDFRGVGFGNADEVMFPLSKNYALMLSTDDSIAEGVNIRPAKESAEMLNYFVTQGSYLEIYSHPSLTSKFSGKALGRRPIVTMEGPALDDLAFMRKYTGVTSEDRPSR